MFIMYMYIYSQSQGYSGRTNKSPDSCYSFWYGATLSLIQSFQYTDIPSTKQFLLLSCQYAISFSVTVPPEGAENTNDPLCSSSLPLPPTTIQHCRKCGFSKLPHYPPDVLHTFYSLGWLSLSNSTSNSTIKSTIPSANSGASIESMILNDINPLTGLRRNKYIHVQNE